MSSHYLSTLIHKIKKEWLKIPKTQEQIKEDAFEYYRGRYQFVPPNPSELELLIAADGVPFYRNDYADTDEEHYLFHPRYLIFSDISFILDKIRTEWAENQKSMRLEDATEEEKKAYDKNIQEEPDSRWAWISDACVCWALIFSSMKEEQYTLLKEEVDLENIFLATLYAFKNGNFEKWELKDKLPQMLAVSVQRNLLPERAVTEIYEIHQLPEKTQ